MAQYIDKDALVAEIERRMDLFQKEKDELPITTETRIARSILSARISMCEELLEYINGISDDEPQQLQPISVPFGNIVDNCAAKCCWEHGGLCTNPQRDCINCPKNWNLEFNTYTTNNIEGNLSANPEDWHVTIKPKISEDTWNANNTTWTEKDEDMLSDCIGAVMAADWYSLEDKEEIESWLRKKFGKNQEQ